MKLTKAHRLWLAGAITFVVLISVTGAVMKERIAKNYEASSLTAAPVHSPTTSRVPTFSNVGIHEFTRTLVKGLPLSATVVMERVQTSADDKTTTRTEFARVYRDNEGRTRHDEMGEATGPEAPVVEDPLKTTINDPATGVSFVIDPKTSSARRKPFAPQIASDLSTPPVGTVAASKQKGVNSQILPVPGTMDMRQGLKPSNTGPSPNAKRESLGRRQVEGLTADGTRIVMTVPAGTANSDKEIHIQCERWYSSSLKTFILIECSDSRYGKSSFRLTQIRTGAPAANLFTVPADFKIYD